MVMPLVSLLFFLTTSATAQIYTLSLHDALPISLAEQEPRQQRPGGGRQRPRDRRQRLVLDPRGPGRHRVVEGDRKSTRLNSSHGSISYAVFCLKKKKHRARSDENRTPEALGGWH